VENCCHAFGALYQGKPVGSFGLVGFTSLSRKHLSVCGTGGIAFTNDEILAKKLAMLRIHGRADYYHSYETMAVGYNFRFNEIQACITCHQLEQVDNWIAQRRENADTLNQLFQIQDLPIELPIPKENVFHSSLHYVIQTDRRDELRTFLAEKDVGTNIHYPVACHLHKAFRDRFGIRPGLLPVAERACDRILTLPATPNISASQLEEIVERVGEFFNT
jgi:dTDP-4-amino-4,6-dideoxygalactose transaminase